MQAKQTGGVLYQTRLISILMLYLFITVFFLSGCTNQYAVDVKAQHAHVSNQLAELGNRLDAKELTNLKLVNIYALKLATLKPELKPIADSMIKDASRQGPLFQNLKKRLKSINLEPENQTQFKQSNRTLNAIAHGADPIIFNDSLLDLINTMADISDGVLKTVSIPKRESSKKNEAIVPGSYLVGNPNYGEYREDSSGKSFWHWYGQYAFFSNLFTSPSYYQRPIYYSRWHTKPRYSYYSDYGRSTYGSYKDRQKSNKLIGKMRSQGITPAKPKKQYGSVLGQKRNSTYSKAKTNSMANSSKKYGSNNSGPRHVSKKGVTKPSSKRYGSNSSGKRTSSYAKNSNSGSANKRTSSYSKNSSSSSYTKRASSYSKSRSSYSSSSRSSSYRRSGK